MSEENNANAGASGLLANLKANPKAIYAAAGAAVVVILVMLMSGGDDVQQVRNSVVVGQTVTVRNPNVGDTLLVASPGKLGSADEESDSNICVVKAGATATIEEESTVNYIQFVKLTVRDGDCQGKTGWAPKVNVGAN